LHLRYSSQSLDKKRYLADQLRLVGSSISNVDLQLCILYGLKIEYDYFVTLSILDLKLSHLFLTHEQQLQKQALTIGTSSSPYFLLNLTAATSIAPILPQTYCFSISP
jgi:hypothetical protein